MADAEHAALDLAQAGAERHHDDVAGLGPVQDVGERRGDAAERGHRVTRIEEIGGRALGAGLGGGERAVGVQDYAVDAQVVRMA